MSDLDFTFFDAPALTAEQSRERQEARMERRKRARAAWYRAFEASGFDEDAAKTAAREAAGSR